MERRLKAYLFDINVAIDEFYSFFELVPKLKTEVTGLLNSEEDAS